MTLESQTQLIRKTLAGDRFAAERLLEPHRLLLLRVAYAALGNRDDAADVTQEALMYALARLSDLRDPAHLGGWLRQITLSHCADYRRRRGTRRLGEPLAVLNEAGEEADFAQRLVIRQALAHLSAVHQTTFLLHYVGGWSLEEVAELTAAPLNTARSRLMAAKRSLRTDLSALFPGIRDEAAAAARRLAHSQTTDAQETDLRATRSLAKGKHMSVTTPGLSETHASLLETTFPGARLLSMQEHPEAWQPFSPRIRVELPEGRETTLDFRGDITPERAALLPVLHRAGIPTPQILHGPVPNANGFLTLCEAARGENLSGWTLGGTPHRIRLATERAIQGIDRLQDATETLLADPVGMGLPHRTLPDEVAILTDDARWQADPWLAEAGSERAGWLADPWFQAALGKVRAAIADINTPLAYTDYLFFFPQGYRIAPGERSTEEPLGWPGDPHYEENPLVEFTNPFGHFGDPLLGLAMVWVYDCYPFVHTGFVEQFLWRRSVTRREFAPRLALKGLQMVARDLPVARPVEGARYWESLRGWVEQALGWM